MEGARVVERRRCDGSWERVVVFPDGSVAPVELMHDLVLERVSRDVHRAMLEYLSEAGAALGEEKGMALGSRLLPWFATCAGIS
jgi:hypothetical protein